MALNWLLLAMGDTWLVRDVIVALPVARKIWRQA
jgi:hypothetical protein